MAALGIGIFWCIYGVLGLFGIQKIPEKYKNADFSKEYKRFSGLTWLLLGVPWLFGYCFIEAMSISLGRSICVLLVCSLPALVLSVLGEKYYRKQIKE